MKNRFLTIAVALLTSFNAHSQTWSTVGTGVNGQVYTMATYNEDLYVGGSFNTAGGGSATNVAKWNGTSWSALGSGIPGVVWSMAEYNGELYVGGHFITAGGITVNGIAKWDGSTWSEVGGGFTNNVGLNTYVYALEVYNDELYAGGFFRFAGGNPAHCISKWDGIAWSPVGEGIDIPSSLTAVQSFEVFENELYVGGRFSQAGGIAASNIARWNGLEWSAVGDGVLGNSSQVLTLTSFQNQLIVGGQFGISAGNISENIISWNGIEWSTLETGVNSWVASTVEYNSELYVGGMFYEAGGVSAQYMAKWDGVSWTSGSGITGGLNPFVNVFIVHDSQLFVGGQFNNAGGISANNIARLTDVATFISNEPVQNTELNDLVIYPNPVAEILNVNWNNPVNTWVYDATGRIVLATEASRVMDVSSLSKGAYSIIVAEIDGHVIGRFSFFK